MRRFRPASLAVALFLAGLAGHPATAEARSPLPLLREGRAEYVRARDVADQLGLAMSWRGNRHLWMSAPGESLEAPAAGASDPREISVNGLRLWLGDPVYVRGGELYFSRTDYECRLVPLLHPGWLGPPPRRLRVIALDPGHGGSDHGTENRRMGLMEKTFTLDVAMRLRRLLLERGYEVVMTRTRDLPPRDKLELNQRSEIANAAHADLFLSVHFNAGSPGDRSSRGTEVYTFPPPRQRSTASWSQHQDDSEPSRAFPAPAPVNRFEGWSVVFAHAMHQQLCSRLGTDDRGERLEHLGVLRNLNCPGILAEPAFLSNDAEARKVADPAFRQRIAEAMLAGIERYARAIDQLRPRQARPAAAAAGLQAPTRPGN